MPSMFDESASQARIPPSRSSSKFKTRGQTRRMSFEEIANASPTSCAPLFAGLAGDDRPDCNETGLERWCTRTLAARPYLDEYYRADNPFEVAKTYFVVPGRDEPSCGSLRR